jgi:DNA-binding response OmpR family regulator
MINQNEIWILEDDVNQLELLTEMFKLRYDLKTFSCLEQLKMGLRSPCKKPDLILADLMLEDGHLFDLLRENLLAEIPYLVISGMDDIDALRYCYSDGALDFIVKPFRKNELIAKVENQIKKIVDKNKVSDKMKVYDAIDFDSLTQKENKILKLLMNSENNQAHRKQMIEYVWGNVIVHHKTLDVHLYNLRKKITDFGFQIKSDGDGFFRLLVPAMS